MKYILAVFLISFSLPALAWTPWDWQESNAAMRCSAVYGTAAYAVKTYPYTPSKDQSAKEVADYFQRLSNLLRYFATNSGFEEEMSEKLKQNLRDEKYFLDQEGNQSLDSMLDRITACDAQLDHLYEVYQE
jgi:hypothetical protein